jgi:preprotein translocase subunit SecG
MGLAIGLLSFALILVCLFLGLLILIQLPKKEAGGIGQAFGGGATDALFGTGSGNALTKATKYSAGAFVVLCVLVSWLTAIQSRSRQSNVKDVLSRQPAAATIPATPLAPATQSPTAPAPTPTPAAAPAPSPAPVAPPK